MTGLVQETHQFREMFEESQIAQSAGGPEVDRLERRDDEFLREARQHNNDTAHVEALLFGKRTNLASHRSRDIRRPAIIRELTQRNCSNNFSVKAHLMSSCVLRRNDHAIWEGHNE